MRKPRVENKYDLTMKIARNLDIGDEAKVREPLFWRNNVVHAWCISKSIGSDRDRRFGSDNEIWIGIYDKKYKKKRLHIELSCWGGMGKYDFDNFYEDVTEKRDLETQEELLKIKKMTFEEAKQRADYSFTLNGIEDLIPGIRKNWMEAMDEDSVPYNGCAVLTIGYVDIEVNIHTEEQISRYGEEVGNKTPVIDYFTCRKIGKSPDDWESDRYLDEYTIQVDWNADNWTEQLEKDMFTAIGLYVIKEKLSFNHPNLSTLL